MELQEDNTTTTPYASTSEQRIHRRNPPYGLIKCNYDCRFKKNGAASQASQAAGIIRDFDGYYLGAGQSRGIGCKISLETELQALLMAMQLGPA